MTFREKIQKERPECTHKKFCGGVLGCPSDYNYENENEGLCIEHLDPSREKCTKCWDREIPTTLDAEKKKMTIDEAIKHCEDVGNGKLCEGTVNHKACGAEHKQLAEWLQELKRTREQKENTTENLCTHTEQFICSKCELHLEDFAQQIYDEDEDETYSVDFEFLYCPGCGRKVE